MMKLGQNVYLLSFTVSGIKNIEKSITLQFYKKSIDKSFEPGHSQVKAIYGENGSGKTGIVLAVQILKNLLLYYNYLPDSKNQDFLHEVINKKSDSLKMECEFYCNIGLSENNKTRVYKYIIELNKCYDHYMISKEQLFEKNAMYSTSKYREVFTVDNGELHCYGVSDQLQDQLHSATTNLLNYRTFEPVLFTMEISEELKSSMLWKHMTMLNMFALSVITSFDISDRQSNVFSIESFTMKWDKDQDNHMTGRLRPKRDVFVGNKRIIEKSDFEEYKKEVNRLWRFLRLFKTDLVSIEIDKKESKDAYECTLIMNYGDYRVSSEFESNGIKKLISLFDYLSLAMDGKIVFIDEMDSNINDIYLCKLVEFFVQYGEGQLCFTTHNTSPMAILKECKNSIDFLSSDNRIISWKRNGNFSPEKLYRNGMIEYLPFNIEAEDFIGILGD